MRRIPRLYLVTDRHQTNGRPLIDVVQAALEGGVDAVQLREKDLPGRPMLELALRLRKLTAEHSARLFVNDRVDVAIACDADGVHLPASSFRIAETRQLLGGEKLIGVSTHDPDEVPAAAREGADFAVFGPVYETPSKRSYGPPRGLETLARAAAATPKLPLLAIGGIQPERVNSVLSRGAQGVAVIRAVLAAENPAAVARELAARLR